MFCLYGDKKDVMLMICVIAFLLHASSMQGEIVSHEGALPVMANNKPTINSHNHNTIHNHFLHAQNILQATMTMFILNKFFFAITNFIHTKRIKDNKSHTTVHVPATAKNEEGDVIKDLNVPRMSDAEKKIFNNLINSTAQDICDAIHNYFIVSIDGILSVMPHEFLADILQKIKKSFDNINQKKGKEQIVQLIKECAGIIFTLNQYHIHANFQSSHDSGDDTLSLEVIDGVINKLNDSVDELKKEIKNNIYLTDDQVKYIQKYIFVNLFPK